MSYALLHLSRGTGFAKVPRQRLTTGLWGAFILLSLIPVISPAVPVAVSNAALAVAAATLAGIVGLVLLYLGSLRFILTGHQQDLFIGLAFGVLALANLLVRVVSLAIAADPEHSMWLLLLLRGVSTSLFLYSLIAPRLPVAPADRQRNLLKVSSSLVIFILIITTLFIVVSDALPPAIEPATQQLLIDRNVIADVLPGQQLWLVIVNSALCVLMAIVTIGYIWPAHAWSTSYLQTLPFALTLLTLGQIHSLAFPPVAPDYVSTALALRLAAYLVLLVGLTRQLGRDMRADVLRAEQLRLSRELHDGLIQYLNLLSLSLGRLASTSGAAERQQQLEAGRQVLELALLEARQAVTTLRTGTLTWLEFRSALESFADEFTRNHEVAVDVLVQGYADSVEARLQADILRLLQEACSNAVRHGRAKQIIIAVTASPGEFELNICDNGQGLDPTAGRRANAVGLQSMAERVTHWGGSFMLDSAPGRGTTITASFSPRDRRHA